MAISRKQGKQPVNLRDLFRKHTRMCLYFAMHYLTFREISLEAEAAQSRSNW